MRYPNTGFVWWNTQQWNHMELHLFFTLWMLQLCKHKEVVIMLHVKIPHAQKWGNCLVLQYHDYRLAVNNGYKSGICSVFLGKIKEAFDRNSELQSLLLDNFFSKAVQDCQVQEVTTHCSISCNISTKGIEEKSVALIAAISQTVYINVYVKCP